MSKLLLIDGHSLAYRAFYALPATMKNKNGQQTNVIHGFVKMLMRLINDFQPDGLAIAFDTRVPTFRHIEYKEYKAHRPPSPPEFRSQVPLLIELLAELGVKALSVDGYEADDLLATLAVEGAANNMKVEIITGDKDILQLVKKNISVMMPKKGLSEMTEYNDRNFIEQTGLTPLQFIDYKSMKGDPSDNIKGVEGIGDKTATQLLQTYGSIDELLNNDLKDLSEKMRNKIKEAAEIMRFNRKLTTLDKKVPIPELNNAWSFSGLHFSSAAPMMKELSLYSIMRNVGIDPDKVQEAEVVTAPPAKNEQLGLFG
ncbi:MAG: 5'-3' exonuclease H3TH domain-containing protein [Candidatus Margulisiibacteriota bacterium]